MRSANCQVTWSGCGSRRSNALVDSCACMAASAAASDLVLRAVRVLEGSSCPASWRLKRLDPEGTPLRAVADGYFMRTSCRSQCAEERLEVIALAVRQAQIDAVVAVGIGHRDHARTAEHAQLAGPVVATERHRLPGRGRIVTWTARSCCVTS